MKGTFILFYECDVNELVCVTRYIDVCWRHLLPAMFLGCPRQQVTATTAIQQPVWAPAHPSLYKLLCKRMILCVH